MLGRKRPRPTHEGRCDGPEVIELSDDDDDGGGGGAPTSAAAASPPPPQPSPPRRLAPLFTAAGAPQPKPKRLILIRHGVTEGYHIIDTPLSPEGRRQAAALGVGCEHLRQLDAVVVSPLRRALQTAVLALGQAWELQPVLLGEAAPGAGGEPAAPPRGAPGRRRLPMYVTPLARERLSTRGDVGTDWAPPAASGGGGAGAPPTPAELRPLVAPVLARLDRGWWARHHHVTLSAAAPAPVPAPRPPAGDASASALPPGALREPTDAFRRRVAALGAALRALPHGTVAVVAHAHTLRELAGSARLLGFCEVQVLPWR